MAVAQAGLQVERGELLVVVGPSGSGKTTLLRMIAGLEDVSRGTISIGGREVTNLPPHQREVAMAFQEHALYPHLTVYDNLAFGLKLRKVPKAEIAQRVKETAELLGLGPLLARSPGALSGGERQRVALGRAVIVSAKVLLLDEPLSNLDAPLRAQMRREIVRIHRRLGTASIYVTHDQTEAMSLGDRLVVMNQGAVQQTGRPLEVYQHPANVFVATFIGTPPMNLFPGTLSRDGARILFQQTVPAGCPVMGFAFALHATTAGQRSEALPERVLAGFRPEHLRLLESAGNPSPTESALEARVEAAEPFGWETHLTLRVGAQQVVARVLGTCHARTEERIRLALDLSQARLFDAGTGQALPLTAE